MTTYCQRRELQTNFHQYTWRKLTRELLMHVEHCKWKWRNLLCSSTTSERPFQIRSKVLCSNENCFKIGKTKTKYLLNHFPIMFRPTTHLQEVYRIKSNPLILVMQCFPRVCKNPNWYQIRCGNMLLLPNFRKLNNQSKHILLKILN